ncbi:hypothetical protein GCM10023321_19280 [Pseudonocardia eucalypti]|uniref:Uncharacterized protein n=2 Tax=Pseudonocardia eucalypti TaxID=648755 RepID=A0ABP9PTB0_9PSEU
MIKKCEISGSIRNASQLPIRVVQVAWQAETRWLIEDKTQSQYPKGPGIWSEVSGTAPPSNVHDHIDVPPQETVEIPPFEVDISNAAPPDAAQLSPTNGVQVRVRWLLVVDNSGRRWEIRPEKGDRAKRVRQPWWKPESPMPHQW